VYDALRALAPVPAEPTAEARDRLLGAYPPDLLAVAGALGTDTPSARAEPRMRRLIHDVRGGGLTVLIGVSDLLAGVPHRLSLVPTAVRAARDHAKVMRACLPELDPEEYARDESARVHLIDGFVRAWDGTVVPNKGREVRVEVECAFRGALTGRCLEAAALDRVIYNLMNNATRFAADDRVQSWVFRSGNVVRWVVRNELAPTDREWLTRNVGTDTRALFAGGITHGGHGIGLSACADVIGTCFGFDAAAAVRTGHIGARLCDSAFYAWFHWPVYELDGPMHLRLTADGRGGDSICCRPRRIQCVTHSRGSAMSNAPDLPPIKEYKSAQYEFNDEQNREFSALADSMRVTAGLMQLAGLAFTVLACLTAAQVQSAAAGWQAYGPAIGLGAAALFALCFGFWTGGAATSFRKVAETKNEDVWHLMNAVGSLRALYGTLRTIIYGSIVLVAIAAGMVAFAFMGK
jgi:hypothetical protein